MIRLRSLCFVVAALVAAPAFASNPSPLIAAMDFYFHNPRAPGTFRALAGMGDPLFGSYAVDEDYSDSPDEQLRNAGIDPGYDNCRADYALRVYNQRLRQLGREHPYFRQWARAQNAVFANCKSYEKAPFTDLPPALPLSDPKLQKLESDDRDYQHASALFYAGRVAEARALFAATRQGSPHYGAAQFMVTAIDAGSQSDEDPSKVKASMLPKAETLLRNPGARKVQAYAHNLIGWIGANADTPETRDAQVGVTIEALELPIGVIRSDGQALARYRQALVDLPRLYHDWDDPDWWLRAGPPPGYYGSAAMMKAAPVHHIAAWALIPAAPDRTDSNEGSESTESAPLASEEGQAFLERVVKSGADGVAWQALSQELASEYDPKVWDRIDAAIARLKSAPTDQDAALVPQLLQYQVNIALTAWTWNAADRTPRVRKVIDELAAYPFNDSDHFSAISSYTLHELMRQGRMTEAREVRDRVLDKPGGYNSYATALLLLAEDDEHLVAAIDDNREETSALLNRLPIAKLTQYAANPKLSKDERARLARAAWTRLYALKRPIPRSLDALMRSLNPEITGTWQSKPGAQWGDRALLIDVLRSPAMNIRANSRTDVEYEQTPGDRLAQLRDIDVFFHSTNNWWCALKPEKVAADADAEIESAFGDKVAFSTLEPMLHASTLWMAFDPSEAAALGRLDSAPKQLSEAAIAWAEHPGLFGRRSGEDEALALAVRTTRYGCQTQGGHGVYSKRAFELLHSKFPQSDAAKRTKYWFDCSHFTFGCTDSPKDDQNYVDIDEGQPSEPASDSNNAPPDAADATTH